MNQIEIKRKQIICYIYVIGVLGLIGMGNLLGDNGLCYLAVALESLSMFILLISAGTADVIARLQKNRRNKGQYKGVARMRKQLIVVQGVTGILLTVICLLLSDILAEKIFGVPNSAAALKLLAPVIAVQALQVVLLGYFQGSGSQMPAVISVVLRQGFFLVFGSLFGKILATYGNKVSGLLKNSSFSGMYSAIGIALGILITELLVLLFLFIIYMGSDRKSDLQKSQEGLRQTDSLGDTVRLFFGAGWQVTLLSLLAVMPIVLGTVFYLNNAMHTDGGNAALINAYGGFFGKCLLPIAACVLILTARSLSVYGRLCVAIHRQDKRYSRDMASVGLHFVWIAGLYMTITMAVMAPQIATGFFAGRDEGVEQLLRMGSAMILLLGLTVLLSMILLAYREHIYLMGALGIWLILDILLQNVFGNSVNSILYGALISTAVLVIGLLIYQIWRNRLNGEFIRILGIPLIASGIMGLVMILVTKLFSAHMSHISCFIVAAILGLIVYSAILIVTKNIREYEVGALYGKLARKLLGRIIS